MNFHDGNWRRRVLIGLGICGGLLLIFHRPLLLGLGHRIALHYAAKESLKLEFQLEGSVFTNLIIKNLHAASTGASDVESIDVDLARIDYGLFTLLRHGLSSAIKNADVHSARVVMNPEKQSLRPRPPNPKKKIDLPDIFPERLHVADATIVVRNRPHDFIAEHIAVDLDPHHSGEITVEKLQLVGGQAWLKLSAPATYANRHLIVREIVLADNERFRSVDVDASQIAARKLAINFDYAVATGNISGSVLLHEAQTSLDTNVRIRAIKVPVDAINKFVALPEGWMRGQMGKFDLDLSGLLSSPATWNGSLAVELTDFHQEQTAFDRGIFQVTAKSGVATLQSADIIRDQNQFHLRGSAELPRSIRDFGRAPTTLELVATLPDLQEVTAGMRQKISGVAEISGKLNIKDSLVNGEFAVTAPSLGFQDGRCENFSAAVKLSKKMPSAGSDKPWFNDLVSQATIALSNLRFRDYVADSVEGSLHAVGQIEWKKGVANGQLSIFGANLRMRDLVFSQLNSQCVIWNDVVYLNDLSANLTGNDFISGNAIVDLHGSHRYSGKFRANVSDLSKLQPLLRTFGNQNELAGSLVVESEGAGEANKPKTGKLRLALDNGRYGNARSLQATDDATYSPDGLG